MISRDVVRNIVLSHIDGTPIFLVDVKVDASNRITVEIDKPEGITIDECTAVSKTVEAEFDREIEDFELEVSSPGLTSPFKVIDQYRKNCGKTVDVLKKDGEKFNGVLQTVSDEGIVLEVKIKTKTAGQKRLQTALQSLPISYSDIKSTRVTINFN
jgi:ribosome maturation factor RimP